MARDKERTEDSEILRGFKFGFGFFLAFLAGWSIIALVATAIYYLSSAI